MSKDSFPIIHALIPARSGSKGIKHKNIKLYNGHPLLAYSIKVAKSIKKISKVIVSTDSEKYRKIALSYGADVPFLRPKIISGDYSTDLECFEQYLSILRFRRDTLPDIIIHLRPSYPNRTRSLLNNCLNTFLKNYESYDSLRTVIPLKKSLFKMYTINDKQLIPTYKQYKNIIEPYNQVRQLLPVTYLHNGCIDIVKKETIEKKNSMSGDKIYPYVMSEKEQYDIDTVTDWNLSINNISDTQQCYIKKSDIETSDIDTSDIDISDTSDGSHETNLELNIPKSLPIKIPQNVLCEKKTTSKIKTF